MWRFGMIPPYSDDDLDRITEYSQEWEDTDGTCSYCDTPLDPDNNQEMESGMCSTCLGDSL